MKNKHYIYFHINPLKNEVFYVAAEIYGLKRTTLTAMLTGQNKNTTDLSYFSLKGGQIGR